MEFKQKILIVDDDKTNLKILLYILSTDYEVKAVESGVEALEVIAQGYMPDLILLDILMPELDGFEVCKRLKQIPLVQNVPVIFLTALQDNINEVHGFEVGCVDYITKPYSGAVILARVQTHLHLVRLSDEEKATVEIIRNLGRSVEYKENITGHHCMRMAQYANLIAHGLGMSENKATQITKAMPFHDIGKIILPDSILQKKESLTKEEQELVRQHPQAGADIIGDKPYTLLKTAKNIALYHHECYDGSGYPFGLSKEEIPIEARIAKVVDVFDVLTSARPYKQAWPIKEANEYLAQNSGVLFDPELIKVFLEHNTFEQVLDIRLAYKRS